MYEAEEQPGASARFKAQDNARRAGQALAEKYRAHVMGMGTEETRRHLRAVHNGGAGSGGSVNALRSAHLLKHMRNQ